MSRPIFRWSRRRATGIARLRLNAARPMKFAALRASVAVRSSENVRLELVARVRAQILAGDYDDPAKLELAFSRMLQSVADE